jgi:hypothetical protein
MKKSLTTLLLASTLALGTQVAYGQTSVQSPSRSSNDFNENGGVSEGSAPGPGAKTNRQRQKEFNEANGGQPYGTARSGYGAGQHPGSSGDPSTPYAGSRDSSPSGRL